VGRTGWSEALISLFPIMLQLFQFHFLKRFSGGFAGLMGEADEYFARFLSSVPWF
jgi:hypothetical protein